MTDQAPVGSMFNPIDLPMGASASPNRCGSCKFFVRALDYGSDRGVCEITLPRWVARVKLSSNNDEDTIPDNLVVDTGRCDLHQGTGKFYRVSTLQGPNGETPR